MYNSYVQYIVIYVLWQFNPKSFIYKFRAKDSFLKWSVFHSFTSICTALAQEAPAWNPGQAVVSASLRSCHRNLLDDLAKTDEQKKQWNTMSW